MTELAALHVRLTGDSGGLVSAVNSADGAITSFGRVTTAAEANARGFDRALRNAGGGATSLQQRINSLTGVMAGSRRSAEASARAFDGLGDEALQSAAQMAAASQQAKAYGTQATSAAMHTGNLAAQFNDIGVMLAAGQNPLQLALQQGTQINQVFGQMGAGASRLRMLGSALVSVISPANLVTIGLIAGGAALFQFGMNALSSRDKAVSLADTLSTLDDIQGNLSDANEILAMTTEELTEKYGQYANEVREAAKSLASLAEAQAIQAMGAALADLGNEFGRLTSSGRTFDTAMTVALERIQEQFKVGYREAQALNEAFVALETATTFEQQVEALRNIEDVMAQTGANAADLPPELITALQQLNLMVISAASVKDEIRDAAAAGRELATSLDPIRLFNQSRMRGSGRGGDPRQFGPDAPLTPSDDAENAAKALRERTESQLEALREGFMSQEELQIAAYESQQEILQSALEQRLITQQEYNDLIQQSEQSHIAAMNQLHQASTMQTMGLYGSLFGNMATIFAAGGDRLVKLTKAFSIAQGLLNSYRAYTEVLADPALIGRPFLRTALAASTLGAGLAQVANMRSIGTGGGGGGGGAVATGSPSAPARSSSNVAINLTGGDMFSRDQVIGLINAINEAQEDGAVVRLV
jgi:hypothetical protein